MDEIAITLGDKIRRMAMAHNINYMDLANQAGISYGKLCSYTRKAQRSSPPLKEAMKLAVALRVPLDWLANDELGFPPPVPTFLPSGADYNNPPSRGEWHKVLVAFTSLTDAILHHGLEQKRLREARDRSEHVAV